VHHPGTPLYPSCSSYMLFLFCQNMMMTCQQIPRIRYVSPFSLGLCPFSELVCDQLPKRFFDGSPKAHCQKSISVTILTSTACTGLTWCLSYPSGGGTIPPALRFLVVREIDCENWLAREYMPAHQHCEWFDQGRPNQI